MAEFEELESCLVSLSDIASAGLASIRKEVEALKASASGVGPVFDGLAASMTRAGEAHRAAAPHMRTADQSMKELKRSAEETGRGLMQMALSVRGGVSSLPQLALGLREATTGFTGLTAALGAVAPESAAAIGALVANRRGYSPRVGVPQRPSTASRCLFAEEMNKPSMAAKELGIGFSALKAATEEGERFGHSSESVIAGIAGIQKAMTDLSQNNSELRRNMLANSVSAVISSSKYSDRAILASSETWFASTAG